MEKKIDKRKVFPCPLCQRDLEIKVSQTRKPYCVCLDCGIQLFVRGKEGISRLGKKTGFELDSFNARESSRGIKTFPQLVIALREANQAIDDDVFRLDSKDQRKKRDDLVSEVETFVSESFDSKTFTKLMAELREANQAIDDVFGFSSTASDKEHKRDDLISKIETLVR